MPTSLTPAAPVPEKASILGYPVSRRGLQGDLSEALRLCRLADGVTRYVACANPHSLMVAKEDAAFRQALMSADILLPDGAGILLASRILDAGIAERVAGMEFFLGLSARLAAERDFSCFFLGSSNDVLERIESRFARDFPGIAMKGRYSPPFREEFSNDDLEHMVDAVTAAAPTVLWVGMTAPKQEKWIHANRHCLRVPLVGAIGAVFDFYAGTKARAPQWVRDLGLEWLPRLLREPRRLWRRNFVSTPQFLWDVMAEAARRRRS